MNIRGSVFKETRQQAAIKLAFACDALGIPALFGDEPWAVIGGAVRDSLLMPDEGGEPGWPDVDIAFCGSPEGLMERLKADRSVRSVGRNSYGGISAVLMNGYALDIWCPPEIVFFESGAPAWKAVLDQIDFGLNAAAYVHSTRSIIVHDQWLADVGLAQIECLAPPRPERGRQAVRSVALHTKLRPCFDGALAFGPRATEEVRVLSRPEGAVFLEEARTYLAHKLKIARWPEAVRGAFERCLEGAISARGGPA